MVVSPQLRVPDIELDEFYGVVILRLRQHTGCQVFSEYMLPGQGSIINISSASAGTIIEAFAYSVAKAGILNHEI